MGVAQENLHNFAVFGGACQGGGSGVALGERHSGTDLHGEEKEVGVDAISGAPDLLGRDNVAEVDGPTLAFHFAVARRHRNVPHVLGCGNVVVAPFHPFGPAAERRNGAGVFENQLHVPKLELFLGEKRAGFGKAKHYRGFFLDEVGEGGNHVVEILRFDEPERRCIG